MVSFRRKPDEQPTTPNAAQQPATSAGQAGSASPASEPTQPVRTGFGTTTGSTTGSTGTGASGASAFPTAGSLAATKVPPTAPMQRQSVSPSGATSSEPTSSGAGSATRTAAPNGEQTQRLRASEAPVDPKRAAAGPGTAAPAAAPVVAGSALDDPAYERFGGANVGAAFFGWLVALGMTVLLSGIVGAVLVVLGVTTPLTGPGGIDLGTASLVSAGVVLVVLLAAYYSGGYVAGRMSRFDGGRQGFAVWLLALLFAVIGGVAGWVAGDRSDVLRGVNLPDLALSGQETTIAGLVSAVVVLGGTLLAAVAGGKVGRRYHAKVDRAL